jgi:hypothetical protein
MAVSLSITPSPVKFPKRNGSLGRGDPGYNYRCSMAWPVNRLCPILIRHIHVGFRAKNDVRHQRKHPQGVRQSRCFAGASAPPYLVTKRDHAAHVGLTSARWRATSRPSFSKNGIPHRSGSGGSYSELRRLPETKALAGDAPPPRTRCFGTRAAGGHARTARDRPRRTRRSPESRQLATVRTKVGLSPYDHPNPWPRNRTRSRRFAIP